VGIHSAIEPIPDDELVVLVVVKSEGDVMNNAVIYEDATEKI